MRAPVSVVIPTLNAEASLPLALSGLGEGLQAGLIRQLVVTDGGSRDATRAIAEAAGADWVSGPPGRGGQLRLGAGHAQGDWLLFLHADTVLQPGWSDAVIQHLREDSAAGYFRLRYDDKGRRARCVAGWANLRARLGLPYGDQGLLISRQMYDGTGGFPDIPLMEDVVMARKLRKKLRPLSAIAETSAERYRREGWLVRGARNLWMLVRFLAGSDPETLARSYRR